MKKKFLCFLLAICMFFNFMNVSVFADEFGRKVPKENFDWAKENFHEVSKKDVKIQMKGKNQKQQVTTPSALVNMAENEVTGQCGDNAYYTIDEDGNLEITGSGDMYNYGNGDSPFYDNSDIKTVVIANRIESIEDYAFAECYSLSTVTFLMDDSENIALEYIEDDAFYDCPLQAIRFEGNLPSGAISTTLNLIQSKLQ